MGVEMLTRENWLDRKPRRSNPSGHNRAGGHQRLCQSVRVSRGLKDFVGCTTQALRQIDERTTKLYGFHF